MPSVIPPSPTLDDQFFWPMLERALQKLSGQQDVYYGWDIRSFREHFAKALADKTLSIPRV